MGRRALDEAGSRHAHFQARNIAFDDLTESVASPPKAGMPEGVGRRVRREIVAVGIDKPLGNDNQAELLALEDAANLIEHLLLIEGHFGKKDDVRGIVGVVAPFCEGCACCYPSRAPAHCLDDRSEEHTSEL